MIERLLWFSAGIVGGVVVTMLVRMPDDVRDFAGSPEVQVAGAIADADASAVGETVAETPAVMNGENVERDIPAPGSGVIARINNMATLAVTDPQRALQQADLLESQLARRLAYERIGAAGVLNAPAQTLALAEGIDDLNLRASFLASSLAALASTDPALAIEHLTTIDGIAYWEALFAQDTITRLAEADPLTLLEASDRMSGDIASTARSLAISAYASLDPDAALRMVDDSPSDREWILQAVAVERAHRDPASVMAWISEVARTSRSVAVSALAGIGETDPDQLLQIALRSPAIHGYPVMAAVSVESFPERIPQIADTLLAAGNEHRDSVTALLHTWARTEPQSVMDWMANNAYAFSQDTWREIGRTVSQQGAAAAAQAITRIPPAMRDSWYEGIAPNLANQHPVEMTRTILGMPVSAGRDRAIGTSLGVLLARGEPIDASLLEAFSSPAARDAAIRAIVGYVQRGNVNQAEQLVPLITDPAVREEFQARLKFLGG